MLTIYYNESCDQCEQLAVQTKKLDWLNRIKLSKDPSPIGVPNKGEIVVVESKDAKFYTGGYATRKICLNIPLYYIFGLLLYVPLIFKIYSKDKIGCNGEYCGDV